MRLGKEIGVRKRRQRKGKKRKMSRDSPKDPIADEAKRDAAASIAKVRYSLPFLLLSFFPPLAPFPLIPLIPPIPHPKRPPSRPPRSPPHPPPPFRIPYPPPHPPPRIPEYPDTNPPTAHENHVVANITRSLGFSGCPGVCPFPPTAGLWLRSVVGGGGGASTEAVVASSPL